MGQARTTGMRRGVVADIEETTRAIRKAMEDAQRIAGVTVDSVYVGIAGEHVQTMTSKGIVAISGDEITRATWFTRSRRSTPLTAPPASRTRSA